MVKHLNGWEMSKKIKDVMENYKKLLIRDKQDHFTIHVETNDLNSEVSPKSIAESIVDHVKTENRMGKQNQMM